MADDLSLLFRLRADNAQAKAVLTDTRAAVQQLRQSFGPQLTQTLSVTNKAFSDMGDNLNGFVAQRLPLVGNALVRVTSSLRGFSDELKKGGPQTAALASHIDSIARSSGKTSLEITRFLTTFTRLQGQASRNEAAFRFFGGSVDLIGNKTAKFLPELEKASAAMGAVSRESASAAGSIAATAGPIGVVVVAVGALAAGYIAAAKEIFALTKATADYQGKLFDLSQQVGVSVETLSALEVAARTTGGSIEGLTQSLGIFQKNLESAAEDSDGKAAKAFKRLGVEATDTETALRQTIASLARMPEGFRQTALALEVFGRGGKAFLAIAKESKGDIDEITRRLQGLGLVTTEQARLADEFNDQLVLLEIQFRGLATKAIPVVLDAMRDLSRFLKENRDFFLLLQGVIQGLTYAIVVPFRAAINTIKIEFQKAQPILEVIAKIFERIKAAIEFISGHPITVSTSGDSATTTASTSAAGEPEKDKAQTDRENERKARLELQGVLNFDAAKRVREAQAAVAQAQREFEAGQRTRIDLLNATIDGIKKQAQAEIDALNVTRKIKLNDAALAKDDQEKQKQIGNEILAIDTQIEEKRHQLREQERDERAKFRKEEEANELAHQERLLQRSKALDDLKIKGIQQRVALGKQSALDGDKEIENIELTAIDREQRLLVKRLEAAGLDLAKRKGIAEEIKKLDVERTTTEQRHSEQRLQIVLRETDITLQLIRLRGESLIASTRTIAATRLITEEQAEQRIAKIKLDALDQEIELARARGQEIRVLEAQREALQAETERDIEAGRQRDLQNERDYANELKQIKDRIRDTERDVALEAIRQLQGRFGSRRELILRQRDLELDEERDRLQRETDSINAQKREIDTQIALLEKHIARIKVGTQEEIEEHDRLIASLEALRLKREELNRQQAAENALSQTRQRRVTRKADADIEETSPFDKLKVDLEDIEDFAGRLEASIVPLTEILSGAFFQVADAIGQVVANWVLLGETGPAVMRKILAQALASIAAEAAVNAVKELALGFATLFFNPAESAGHFVAAGLWASIAGGSALAGRAVAGDLFKPKSSGGSGGGGGSGGSSRSERDPIDLFRQQQVQVLEIRIHAEPGARFNDAVVNGVLDSVRSNGPMRTIVKEVAES